MFHTASPKEIIEGRITDVYFERTLKVLNAKGITPVVRAEFIAKSLPETEKRKIHENMIFTGFIPDIMDAYIGADLFFMPSHAETFGLVILEALASGLPVLARGIPEFREIFGDSIAFFEDLEDAGQLVQSRDRWSCPARRPGRPRNCTTSGLVRSATLSCTGSCPGRDLRRHPCLQRGGEHRRLPGVPEPPDDPP